MVTMMGLEPKKISGNKADFEHGVMCWLKAGDEGRWLMSNDPVLIRLFFAKMKPAFFELSQSAQTEFMARDRANLDALGMRAIAMVDCRGKDEEWEYIGVEEWPSESALRERQEFEAEDLQISHYVEYKTHVGTGQSFENYGKS